MAPAAAGSNRLSEETCGGSRLRSGWGISSPHPPTIATKRQMTNVVRRLHRRTLNVESHPWEEISANGVLQLRRSTQDECDYSCNHSGVTSQTRTPPPLRGSSATLI